jgi:hypothetical protein
MGARNQLLCMSSKREILRGRYSGAYFNAIRQVSSGYERPACRESEPQNRAVLARNGRTYHVTSYEHETRNASRSVLRCILQCYPTGFIRIRPTGTVPARQESKPQNHGVLARKGRTYPDISYELETRNPSRLELRSIVQCYPTSFVRIRATGTVPAHQDSEPQNHAVLARNGRTYPVTSYEPEMRNPSRSVLWSILQCYPISSGYERPARFRHAMNLNHRVTPFGHEMGERTQSLRMSSK